MKRLQRQRSAVLSGFVACLLLSACEQPNEESTPIDTPVPEVVITEVSANGTSDDFVEVLNLGEPISFQGWQLANGGDATELMYGLPDWPAVETGDYVVVVMESYSGDLAIPDGTVVLTTQEAAPGDGLSAEESVILLDDLGNRLTTYGSPDDESDALPIDPGGGSIERCAIRGADVVANWEEADVSPGSINTCDEFVVGAPSGNGHTKEAGVASSFPMRLRVAPTSDVSIPLTTSDTSEGTAPASVAFTPANWDVDQDVTVTGVDDTDSDGHQSYVVTFGEATSDDPVFSGTTHRADVSLQNRDNDGGRLDLSIEFDSEHEGETAGLRVIESGGFVVACDNTQIITGNMAAFVMEGVFVVGDTYTVELFAGRDGNTTYDALQDHPLIVTATIAGEDDLVVSGALETDFGIIGTTWPTGTGCED